MQNAFPDQGPNQEPERRVRIWDLPTRLFHWLIVALFGFSWWTAANDHLDWHKASGYGILTLVLFRIYWGVAGSTTSRFAGFVRGPRSLVGYGAKLFRRAGAPAIGHNPMGGWSVLVLLALLLAQAGLGLFAVDVDGLDPGPFGNFVSFDMGRRIAHWHGKLFNILLIFTGIHVLAIAFYLLYRRENLTAAMIVGTKRVPADIPVPPVRFVALWWAVMGLAVAAAIVAFIAFGRF